MQEQRIQEQEGRTMKATRKLLKVFLLMVAALTISSVLPGMAMAAGKVKITTDTAWIGTHEDLYFDDTDSFGEVDSPYGTNMPGSIKIISAKSNKPGVLKLKLDKEFNCVELNPKKPGKCKVTVKYEDETGKKITTSKTIQVKKPQDALKALKVNGKNIKVKKGQILYFPVGLGSYKGDITIDVTLQPGWKIVKGKKKSYVWRKTMDDEGNDVVEHEAFINGMTLTKDESYNSVLIKLTLQNKKKEASLLVLRM